MPQPALKILYPKGVTQEEVGAALKGVKDRFSSFGLMCEAAIVGPGRTGSVPARDVYSGEKLVTLITSDSPLIMALDLHGDTIMGAFRTKSVFGLGITGRQLHQMPENESGKAEPRIGSSYTGRSGIISIFKIRTFPEDERVKAIGIASAHEIGHILGRNGHCENPVCLMGENHDTEDFLVRFVRQTRELCDECGRTIERSIISFGRHG